MKIGDKVRFLNDVGGGVISGFQGKDTVLVEDQDGFDIPVLKSECVLVSTDESNKAYTKEELIHQEVSVNSNREDALDATILETNDGNVLNAYLAFVPQDIKQISTTSFDAFLVNDSNYFLYFTYSNEVHGSKWSVRSHDLIAPNTKLYLETFTKSNLNELEHLRIQLIAFKHDRNYQMKLPIDKILDIDPVKFYKLHSFKDNDFFEESALVFTIVENDDKEELVKVDVQALKEGMLSKSAKKNSSKKSQASDIVVKQMGKQSIVEVDLHIDELLDSTLGLDSTAMITQQLKRFNEVMRDFRDKKNQKIVFIHGKGEGVLRKALIQELRKNYKSCTYQDASFQEYGFGATMITIH